MTKKSSGGASERKRQKRLMKKRQKDQVRHRARSTSVSSENAIQHQMLGEFGSVENFVKNLHNLAGMMREEEDLKTLRFDAKALYEKLDLADPKTNAALTDLYTDDDYTYYAEEYEEFWKDRRGEILPDLVTDDVAQNAARIFKVLLQKKRGFKREYRAALAGNLLVQSHIVALQESPVAENNLWEMMFNATLKDNKVELPAPREETPAADTAEEPPAAEPSTES
ncbi:MAG: hypothetical protein M5R36_03900 [Deltaproteobacteria bacterium]|nr:hypothetical protein [Deltaproteobacteria bacterium]